MIFLPVRGFLEEYREKYPEESLEEYPEEPPEPRGVQKESTEIEMKPRASTSLKDRIPLSHYLTVLGIRGLTNS